MYISGSYYVIKRGVAIDNLLDENLVHGRGEDVEYSKRLHLKGHIIKCNSHSDVVFLHLFSFKMLILVKQNVVYYIN